MRLLGADGKNPLISKRFWGIVILFVANILAYFGVDLPESVYMLLELLGLGTVTYGAAVADRPWKAQPKAPVVKEEA